MLYKVSLGFRYDHSKKSTSELLPYTLSRTRPTAGAFGISTYETTEKLGSADAKKYMFQHALKTNNKATITAQWFRIKHFKTPRQNKGFITLLQTDEKCFGQQTSAFGFWAIRLRFWVKLHEICITVKSQQSVKCTFFSFLASSIVLRGATPRTIANARPRESKKNNSNINIVISEFYNSVDKWSGYPV